MNTEEIRLVDYDDEVGFDECMGNENMQLVFDQCKNRVSETWHPIFREIYTPYYEKKGQKNKLYYMEVKVWKPVMSSQVMASG